MTQNEKDLLIKDLCTRLPYGVILDCCNIVNEPLTLINCKGLVNNDYDIDEVKPYLFPLSSMNDELWDKEFMGCSITEFTRDSFKYGCETLCFYNCNPRLSSTVRFINQLIKNHFDIYGLIPMGLAIDATGKNIY